MAQAAAPAMFHHEEVQGAMSAEGAKEGPACRGAESQALHSSRHSAPSERVQDSRLPTRGCQPAGCKSRVCVRFQSGHPAGR